MLLQYCNFFLTSFPFIKQRTVSEIAIVDTLKTENITFYFPIANYLYPSFVQFIFSVPRKHFAFETALWKKRSLTRVGKETDIKGTVNGTEDLAEDCSPRAQ